MEFSNWLQDELNKRGWDHAELVRRTGLSSGGVSHVMNGDRKAGPDFCIAVARAFGISREEVFRARGWLIREPEQVISPLAPPRVIDHMERLINYPPVIRDLLLDAYDAVEGTMARTVGLVEGTEATEGDKQTDSIMRNDTEVCRSEKKNNQMEANLDLSLFPEEDREIISQLNTVFQEYLTALVKHSPAQYADAMNYAKTQAAAEMRRLQRTQDHRSG